jgi:hypothetical protein
MFSDELSMHSEESFNSAHALLVPPQGQGMTDGLQPLEQRSNLNRSDQIEILKLEIRLKKLDLETKIATMSDDQRQSYFQAIREAKKLDLQAKIATMSEDEKQSYLQAKIATMSEDEKQSYIKTLKELESINTPQYQVFPSSVFSNLPRQ